MAASKRTDIAIVGIACRFPGAKTVDDFWENLIDGRETITFFSDEELLEAGVEPEKLDAPNYVRAYPRLDDVDRFDASFFGVNPREAEITDPQQRFFLECAWEALEDAGYDPERYEGLTGVWSSVGFPYYMTKNLMRSPAAYLSLISLIIGNDKDYVPTRVSYKLNLRGPSMNVQSACSSSGMGVYLACQSLIEYQCDMALAGGCSIRNRQTAGYMYDEGGMQSKDGHCRPFDAGADGTIFGSGVGIVVLKRLEDARADGDHIYAVIKGFGASNDGSAKVGYTAPSVDGQASAVAMAHAVAEVKPETITYVEAHGTGTPLGDPIEVTALTRAFRAGTKKNQFCALGSVKSNIGHMDSAASIAGIIKASLALKYKQIPPSINFDVPNPEIDFDDSPFFVNTALRDWETNGHPRRAGVNSAGIGGTNAHFVLEEPPALASSDDSRPWHLLVLSAKTETALEQRTSDLREYLQTHPDVKLADVAYTLQVGRAQLEHRTAVLCRNRDDAIEVLDDQAAGRTFTALRARHNPPVVFMFSGQGSQYPNMARELYEEEPTFRRHIDACAELLEPQLGVDLRDLLYPDDDDEAAAERLKQTAITQPALFATEYALARLWMSWGVHPTAMIGHSIGEYAAACVAGVFSLEDALALVATRGRLMQELPQGSMLAVPLPESEVEPLLGDDLSVATINSPSRCVVSGPDPAIESFAEQLRQDNVSCSLLHTSHAFHSPMMAPMLPAFEKEVRTANPQPPQIDYISNVTGTWITDTEATSPKYWANHLRHAVRFADGVRELRSAVTDGIFLEVGPGRTLNTLVRRQVGRDENALVLSSTRHVRDQEPDEAFLLKTVARLWLAGVDIDWSGLYANEQRRRVSLPTYPFQGQRYWIEPSLEELLRGEVYSLRKKSDMADWFYVPSWKRATLPASFDTESYRTNWLVFCDDHSLGDAIVQRLDREATRNRIWLGDDEPFRLKQATSGNLDSFALEPIERERPGAGQVEIEVYAAGLNFKDVLIALDMHPGTQVPPIGLECAGKVVRVGEGVDHLEVGDDVIAATLDAFGAFCTCSASGVVRKPEHLTFEEAAGIPIVFLTASYTVRVLGNLREGERILIQTASGGVGMAAVQYAQRIGAEIFATAGSPEKRTFLRSLGIKHVFDSRTLEFADGIMDRTDGEGVDVVLNTLPGEYITKGLSILAPGGRFVEISLRDILNDNDVGLLPFQNNLSFSAFDLTKLATLFPEKTQNLMQEIVDDFSTGRLHPLPTRVFSMDAASDAFKYMANARHIGKVVLSRRDPDQRTVVVTPGETFRKVGSRRYTVNPREKEHYGELIDALAASDQMPQRIIHTWNVVSPESDAGAQASPPSGLQASQERGFYSLLYLAQALGQHAVDASIQLGVVINNLHQVTDEPVLRPERATALGPCRVIPREYPHIACRNIDVVLPAGDSSRLAALADSVLTELCVASDEEQIAYRGRHRWVQTFAPVPLGPADGTTRLRQEGVYLITGGLGGIGLTLGDYLANHVQARLILTGRSALPEREQWDEWLATHAGQDDTSFKIRRIRALERAGAEVLAVSADVTDVTAMEAVVARANERFGTLNGVIHAAGVPGGGLIQLKTPEMADAVLAPKVTGTNVLETVLRDTSLDFFALCSSLTSIIGYLGQVDYCGANAFLDAFAHYYSDRTGTFTVSLNWDAWQDVGMAADAITEEATSPSEQPAEPAGDRRHPLLGRRIQTNDEETVYSVRLSPKTHWVLSEHRIFDMPMVPGTTYLEIARAAFEDAIGDRAIELRDIVFTTPLVVGEDEHKEARIILEKTDSEAFDFRVVSRAPSGNGEEPEWQEHVGGTIHELDGAAPALRPLDDVVARCDVREVSGLDVEDQNGREQFVEFGPRWKTFETMHMGAGEGVARIRLPAEFADDLDEYKLHPALLDVAVSVTTSFFVAGSAEPYLPLAYNRLTVKRPLSATLYCHVEVEGDGGNDGEILTSNATLMDTDGNELVVIEGFSMKKLSSRAITALQERPADGDAGRQRDEALIGDLRTAIAPQEGVEAFLRALAQAPLSQMAIATRDLDALYEQARADGGSDADDENTEDAKQLEAMHERPNLPTKYVAPGNRVEEQLARIWQQVIGIQNIGVHDHLFDLGADSVIGMQIVGKAKDAGIELTPDQLFEYPTIAGLVEALEAAGVVTIEADGKPEQLPLTSDQARLLRQHAFADSDSWSHALLLELNTPEAPAASVVEKALRLLLDRHAALRLQFVETDAGWQQILSPPDDALLVVERELCAPSDDDEPIVIEEIVTALKQQLRPAEGPVVAAALLTDDGGTVGRLLLVTHELVADNYSRELLLEELQIGVRRFAESDDVEAPLGIDFTSFPAWVKHLVEYAHSETIADDVDYWQAQLWHEASPWPTDAAQGANANTFERVVERTVRIATEQTTALLEEVVPQAYKIRAGETVLAVVGAALAAWTGMRCLLVHVHEDGRDAIFDDVDLSRTVGRCTYAFPLLLDLREAPDAGAILEATKAQYRRVPKRGIGYGLLRTVRSDELGETLGNVPHAQISFRYRRSVDRGAIDVPLPTVLRRIGGPASRQRGRRPYLLEITAAVVDTQLTIDVSYSEDVYERSTIEELVRCVQEAVDALIAHCRSLEKPQYSPADFPEADLDAETLDQVLETIQGDDDA